MSTLDKLTKNLGNSGVDTDAVRFSDLDMASASPLQVVNLVGREIVRGKFAPGSRLPNEATMRERYSVSRTALREAYSKLAAKGLIKARPKIGTHVRPQSDWNMLDPEVLTWHLQTMPTDTMAKDLFALRRMVEPPAAALAAKMRSDESLAAIASAYNDMKACSEGESDLIDADFRFHVAILTATENHFIGAFSALIQAAMLSTFRLSWRGAAQVQYARIIQHETVLDAIRDQKPGLARERMETLLDDSIRDVLGALSNDAKT
ncbi:MAG: FadR family transcriptional regulator [Rhodobacteraceae bacterium]|nr:FadR family transcriptional regulator [Paracoccaceae bacterium]